MLEIKNWSYLYSMVACILIVIALEPCNPLCEHTNPYSNGPCKAFFSVIEAKQWKTPISVNEYQKIDDKSGGSP